MQFRQRPLAALLQGPDEAPTFAHSLHPLNGESLGSSVMAARWREAAVNCLAVLVTLGVSLRLPCVLSAASAQRQGGGVPSGSGRVHPFAGIDCLVGGVCRAVGTDLSDSGGWLSLPDVTSCGSVADWSCGMGR